MITDFGLRQTRPSSILLAPKMPELKNFHIKSLARVVTLWFGIKFSVRWTCGCATTVTFVYTIRYRMVYYDIIYWGF